MSKFGEAKVTIKRAENKTKDKVFRICFPKRPREIVALVVTPARNRSAGCDDERFISPKECRRLREIYLPKGVRKAATFGEAKVTIK